MSKRTWLQAIAPKVREEYATELGRLAKHIASAPKAGKNFRDSSLGKHIAESFDPAVHLRFALATLSAADAGLETKDRQAFGNFVDGLAVMLRRALSFKEEALGPLLRIALSAEPIERRLALIPGVLAAADRITVSQGLAAEHRQQLLKLRDGLAKVEKPNQKVAGKLTQIIDQLCDDSAIARLQPDGGWADDLQTWFAKLKAPACDRWNLLLRHGAAAKPEPPATDWKVEFKDIENWATRISDPSFQADLHRLQLSRLPSTTWTEELSRHADTLGKDVVAAQLERWLHKVPTSKPGMLARPSLNRELLRGLLWLCVHVPKPEIAQAVQHATRFLYQKKSPLGTIGVVVLYHMGTNASAGALAALGHYLKWESHRELAAFALAALAEKGIDADDLGEDAIPTFGFTERCRWSGAWGDVQAEIRIEQSRNVVVEWQKGGKVVQSVPAAIKREHGDEVEALKTTAKGIREALSGLAARLEATWLTRGKLQMETWRNQLIDHPVASAIGRRLIWKFDRDERTTVAYWRKKGLVNAAGRPVQPPDGSSISLWHPLQAKPEEVLAWRERLEADQVTQPFKQAHREVYLLTAAERQTQSYSNRFAGHIIRQAQFRQLAKGRGWKAGLVGPWDSFDANSERKLPHWGLRAEFWVQGAGDQFQTGYTYVATDQVRFYLHQAGQTNTEPLPLTEVPPLVFSEVMRDVDLFVGVASVGNDPNWADGGPRGRYRDYWQGYAFGELSATARTRREVLERLVPRLKIGPQCSFTDKFLVVQGKLRSYKIHLGSGNILMTPNDQYLCIVAKQGNVGDGKVFLPFEGDGVMSVILSKAFLLAEDDQIKDATITSQIGRK